MKVKKLTVIGCVGPVEGVEKFKEGHTDISTVGPANEPGKKENPDAWRSMSIVCSKILLNRTQACRFSSSRAQVDGCRS